MAKIQNEVLPGYSKKGRYLTEPTLRFFLPDGNINDYKAPGWYETHRGGAVSCLLSSLSFYSFHCHVQFFGAGHKVGHCFVDFRRIERGGYSTLLDGHGFECHFS